MSGISCHRKKYKCTMSSLYYKLQQWFSWSFHTGQKLSSLVIFRSRVVHFVFSGQQIFLVAGQKLDHQCPVFRMEHCKRHHVIPSMPIWRKGVVQKKDAEFIFFDSLTWQKIAATLLIFRQVYAYILLMYLSIYYHIF